MLGGAGKLGELFKSAETSGDKPGGQQQQNLGQLFKSAQSQPAAKTTGKSHLGQKNLPNLATVEASPPSQVGSCEPPFIYFAFKLSHH